MVPVVLRTFPRGLFHLDGDVVDWKAPHYQMTHSHKEVIPLARAEVLCHQHLGGQGIVAGSEGLGVEVMD